MNRREFFGCLVGTIIVGLPNAAGTKMQSWWLAANLRTGERILAIYAEDGTAQITRGFGGTTESPLLPGDEIFLLTGEN